MPFQAVPDVASFKIVSRSNSSAVEINNIWYVRNTVLGWSADRLEDMAIAIGDAWRDEVMPLLSADATFDRVEARDEGAEFGEQYSAEYNTVGGIVGTPLSAMVCMLVQIRCSGGGAPRGGRLFLSPFSEAQIARDAWDATLLTDVQTAIQAVNAAVDTVTEFDASVRVSRWESVLIGGVPVATKRDPATSNTIASFETRELVSVQRDRRTGIGA